MYFAIVKKQLVKMIKKEKNKEKLLSSLDLPFEPNYFVTVIVPDIDG